MYAVIHAICPDRITGNVIQMWPDVATRGGRGPVRGTLSLRRSTLRAGTLYIRTRAREGVFMVTSRGSESGEMVR